MQMKSTFRDRLGNYLMGVAIGCVLVGMLMMARSRMAARQAAPVNPPANTPGPVTQP